MMCEARVLKKIHSKFLKTDTDLPPATCRAPPGPTGINSGIVREGSFESSKENETQNHSQTLTTRSPVTPRNKSPAHQQRKTYLSF